MESTLEARLADVFPGVTDGLRRLIAIPSVSAGAWDEQCLRQSAHETVALLRSCGLADVRALELEGAPPYVYGRRPGPPGAPRVLLYAHHDVQPPGPLEAWSDSPFLPVTRGGRLYGRGAADNKAGIAAHAAAIACVPASSPIELVVLIEGEEEVGSPNLARFLGRYGTLFLPDVIVSTDAPMPHAERPGLTASFRGLVDCVVEVRTLPAPVHSGVFGGAAPDALSALVRVLVSLHDDDGRVAVADEQCTTPRDLPYEGIGQDVMDGLMAPLRGAQLLSDPEELPRRLWLDRAVSVIGLDAPGVMEASGQLVADARAKVSLRLRPEDDPAHAVSRLRQHLEASAPWGARVVATPGACVPGLLVDTSHPAFELARDALAAAWGTAPVVMGSGGSMPAIVALAARFPDAPILMFGAADPAARSHGPDESVSIDAVRRTALAEVLLLDSFSR